jgi:trehalose/maltose hydrolase-like predicted phosphorylase
MKSDIYDTQGGTTPEGIHCGVMAGTLDLMTRYFSGIDFSHEIPEINPHLPDHWQEMSLKVCHKNIWYDITLTQDKLQLCVTGRLKAPLPIKVRGKTIKIKAGERRSVYLH